MWFRDRAEEELGRRGYGPDVVSGWGIGLDAGWWSHGDLQRRSGLADARGTVLRERLVFPVLDWVGGVVGLTGRRLHGDGPKWLHTGTPFHKGQHLYGLWRAADSVRRLDLSVLVEGPCDAVTCHMAGINVVVSTLGSTVSERQASLLRRFCSRAVLLYDPDRGGNAGAEKAVAVLRAAGLTPSRAVLRGGDPDEVVRGGGPDPVLTALREAIGR